LQCPFFLFFFFFSLPLYTKPPAKRSGTEGKNPRDILPPSLFFSVSVSHTLEWQRCEEVLEATVTSPFFSFFLPRAPHLQTRCRGSSLRLLSPPSFSFFFSPSGTAGLSIRTKPRNQSEFAAPFLLSFSSFLPPSLGEDTAM